MKRFIRLSRATRSLYLHLVSRLKVVDASQLLRLESGSKKSLLNCMEIFDDGSISGHSHPVR